MDLPFDMAMDQRFRSFLRDRLPPYLSPLEKNASYGGAYYQSCLPIKLDSSVRLLRKDCIRVLIEDDLAVVYTSIDNHRGYREIDEQSIAFGVDFGPAIEFLIETYPDFCKVSDLPELDDESKIEFVASFLENKLLRFE